MQERIPLSHAMRTVQSAQELRGSFPGAHDLLANRTRKSNHKPRATAGNVLRSDGAAMLSDDRVHDGETEP